MQQFVPFQSTLSWLKGPPSNYPLPPVDILGGIQKIRSAASSGKYSNQYDFELDTTNLINSAFDGHFSFRPFLPGAFEFATRLPLVSISDDGQALPKVYILGMISTSPQSSLQS
jgi:hypothetical protein